MIKAASGKPQVFRGMLMVLTAVAFFSVVDVLSKYLAQFYPVGMVVWARYTFHLLLVVVVLGPRFGLALVRTARPGTQMLRGLLLAIASILFVNALKYLPLAESTAIAYLAPLLVTLMSVLFLKEKVELARWLAVACGFIGVLTIVRPGSSVFTWAVLLPIGNALAFATYQILTRRLAGLESPYTSIFYSGLVGTLLLSAALPYSWVMPINGVHTAMLIILGMIGGLGHLILIKAYDHAPASRLAPFSYSQLIWVTTIGYLAFGDFPDTWSLVGIAVLVASGIYTATHQRISDWLQRLEQTNVPPSA
jgi:drug/metabolite transporter (DMT)-like permease